MFNAMAAQYATPEVSGDGLVSWEHGKKCVIPSVKLYGAAVQATLEGKNLFDLAGRVQRQLSGAANTTPREFDGHSYYVGLSANNYYYPTFVADFSIDARDGAVSVQGGNQSGYGLAFDFPAAPGETYTISFTPSQETIRTSWYDAEGYPINNSGGKSPYIITAPDNAKWLVVLFSPGADTAETYSNIQLELGPTVTAYEPYCGGIPAPNPSYPIQPVCNNGVFAGRGRNLFDSEGFAQELLALTSSSRVTVDGRDCIRFLNNQSNGHYAIQARENTQYTIRIAVKADGIPETVSGILLAYLRYTDGTSTDILHFLRADNAQAWVTAVVSSAPDKTLSHLTLSYGSAWYWYIDIGSIQMVEGVHTADTMPPYTPYYDGGQAQAPELWAIPGTEYRDEWDPQTGRGIRRVLSVDALDPRLSANYWIESTSENSMGCYFTSERLFGIYGAGKIISRVGICSHSSVMGTSILPQTQFVWSVAGDARPPYIGLRIPVLSGSDVVPWLQAQEDAGTPVRFLLALVTPEPFYHPPAKLTMPTGYGQIIQTSGDVPDCPITARYLTHS